MIRLIKFIQKTHLIQRISEYKNIIFGVITIITGVFTTNFIIVSGVYSVLTGIAIRIYLKGEKDAKRRRRVHYECYYFKRMALFILTGALAYIAYMISLFFTTVEETQVELLVYIMAFFAGLSFIIAVVGLITAKTLLRRGLKSINLSTALVSISLYTAAILAANNPETTSNLSAILGLVVGFICIIISAVMLIWYCNHKKRAKEERAKGYRRIS
jgi:hypothetical protein